MLEISGGADGFSTGRFTIPSGIHRVSVEDEPARRLASFSHVWALEEEESVCRELKYCRAETPIGSPGTPRAIHCLPCRCRILAFWNFVPATGNRVVRGNMFDRLLLNSTNLPSTEKRPASSLLPFSSIGKQDDVGARPGLSLSFSQFTLCFMIRYVIVPPLRAVSTLNRSAPAENVAGIVALGIPSSPRAET